MRLLAAIVVALSLALVACGEDEEEPRARRAPVERPRPTRRARRTELETVADGKLTVGTDKPAFPPYFEDDDPTNGKGFESAVAYAIARELGFEQSEVEWTVVPFNASYRAGPEGLRLRRQPDLDHARAGQARRLLRSVLHGAAGRDRHQGLARRGRHRASPTSRTSRSACRSAPRASTRSTASIQPSTQPKVFDDSNAVVTALKQDQVDAVVVDLPTALFLTAVEIPGASIVGQFDAPGGDEWGALLEKDSALTACVNEAITTLKDSGELDEITQQWMSESADAPVLQ